MFKVDLMSAFLPVTFEKRFIAKQGKDYGGIDRNNSGTSTKIHRSAKSSLKRCIDIIGSLVGLTLLAIMFLPIAIAIKLDNPGPIFYSQIRCGLRGKTFRIYKFRSMVSNADAIKHLIENESVGHIFKNSNDPRVTAVGRFLRKTSLDEFPQFLNVLKGEMSLVGTRPPTVGESLHYDKRHWKRLLVKPGLTGQWQVNGRSEIKDFEAIVDLDLLYQERWTEFYDIQLIIKTITVLLSRNSGAH